MYEDDEYDYMPDPYDFGYVSVDEIPDLEFCEDQLKRLLDAIYVSKDARKLQDSVEELANQFKVPLPYNFGKDEQTIKKTHLKWR